MKRFKVETHVGVTNKRTIVWAVSHEKAYESALRSWGLSENQVTYMVIITPLAS